MTRAAEILPVLSRWFKHLIRRRRPTEIILLIWVTVPALTLILLLVANLRKPWEFDESYNLQVVENLRAGHGFASNGAYRGVGPYEFDPWVSTGPSVLLPIWVVAEILRSTFVAARLVMFTYFALLIASIRRLLPRNGEGSLLFGALLILIAPVVSATNPLYVLGEIPAIALIVTATWAAWSHRYGLAGWLCGMVVLCKLNFVIATGVLLLLLVSRVILDRTSSRRDMIKSVTRLVVGCVAPIFLFELYRLISLGGIGAYRQNINELRTFISTQRLDDWTLAPGLFGDKVRQLAHILPTSGWTLLAVAVLVIVATGKATREREGSNSFAVAGGVLIAPVMVILGTFLFLSNVPFIRQGAGTLLLLIPVPVMIAMERLLTLSRDSAKRVRFPGIATLGGMILLMIPFALSEFVDARSDATSDRIGSAAAEQRNVARIVRDSGATGIVLDGWFQNPELQLLSGVPALSMPGTAERPIIVVADTKFYFGIAGSLQEEAGRCGEILYQSDRWLVCWPLDETST